MAQDKNPPAYDRTLSFRGHRIRIQLANQTASVFHDDELVAERTSELGLLVFQVEEDGAKVAYDVAVMVAGDRSVRVFVGRDGDLMYSNDPAFPVDKTDLVARPG